VRSAFDGQQFPGDGLDFATDSVSRPAFQPFANMDPRYSYDVELHYGFLVGDPNWSSAGSVTVQVQARRNSAAAWSLVDEVAINLGAINAGAVVDQVTSRRIPGASIPGFVIGDEVEFRGSMGVNTGGDNANSIALHYLEYNGNLKITEVL
jgi:hypothetical protein